jgi:hypothetical protein
MVAPNRDRFEQLTAIALLLVLTVAAALATVSGIVLYLLMSHL